MDINELNKTQLILLTLLITFVVSIATGIITVSIMQQMPKSVPQTINNVIQRTIEKVTTSTPAVTTVPVTEKKDSVSMLGDGDAIVSIYEADVITTAPDTANGEKPTESIKPLGQGIIISDVGLILVDSSILNDKKSYKVILNKLDFDATVIKDFSNGFSVLKISKKQATAPKVEADPKTTPTKVDKQE